MIEGDLIVCGCCGRGIVNNLEQNTHFGQVPYPDDEGFGMCVECGGDKNSTDFKKRIGWSGQMFYEARFDIVRKALKPENQKSWDGFSYEKKCIVIVRFVEKGLMI